MQWLVERTVYFLEKSAKKDSFWALAPKRSPLAEKCPEQTLFALTRAIV